MSKHPTILGLSFSLTFGAWAKPRFGLTEYTARVCLGFVSLTVMTFDLERMVTLFAREIDALDEQLAQERAAHEALSSNNGPGGQKGPAAHVDPSN